MAKVRKTKRSRFDGIDLNTLNQDAAKVTGQENMKPVTEEKQEAPVVELKAKEEIKEEVKETKPKRQVTKSRSVKQEEPVEEDLKRGKGRPKSSSRKPLNTAIEPKNRQRLEFLAMLNGGSVADQLNDILERYFTEVEKVDELIEIFEERKRKRK